MSTELSSSVASGTAPPVAGSPAGRARTRLVAAALATGATAAAVNLLARPVPADDISDYAALAPVRDAVLVFAVIGGLAFAVTYLAAGLAGCLLAPARGAAWASVGAVCTGIGGIGLGAGFFALGAADWLVTTDAIPPDAAAALFAYYQDNSVRIFGVQAAGFLLCVVGLILLAVALWRARSVPRWLAVAPPLTLVLAILGGSGLVYDVLHAVFMATLVTTAGYLWRMGADRTVSPGRGIASSA